MLEGEEERLLIRKSLGWWLWVWWYSPASWTAAKASVGLAGPPRRLSPFDSKVSSAVVPGRLRRQMEPWPRAGNPGNVKEGALKMLERPPASPGPFRAWPPGKCIKVQVWKLLTVILIMCESTRLVNKWINMVYYLFCSSTVFDTRITFQEISCCLYKLSVLTKRLVFLFHFFLQSLYFWISG